MAQYDPPEVREYGAHKTVTKWWDASDLIAEIREYDNPSEGGHQLVVCQLQDGDTMYYTG